MADIKEELISETEVVASKKRAARLKEISEEFEMDKDSEMAKMVAEIAARNKVDFEN